MQLLVLVVGKLQPHIGKTQAVSHLFVSYTQHARPVAIGKKANSAPFFLRPMVIVLHHHQQIARGKQFFAAKHRVSDALVKNVRPLVAACHHDGFVHSHLCIAGVERLDKLVARNNLQVGEPLQTYSWQQRVFIAPHQLAQTSGVKQNAASRLLPYHLVQVACKHLHSIALHKLCVECRTLFFTHWRQLSLVADEHKTAIAPSIDISHKVV